MTQTIRFNFEEFRNDCKTYRKKFGLTNMDIAALAGLPISTVLAFFKGKFKGASMNTVAALAYACRLNMNDYYTDGWHINVRAI